MINSFIAGNYLFDTFNDDKGIKKFVTFSVLFLFGAPWVLLYLIIQIPMFKWLRNEITFICHFYFTDYWDKIMLDDNYSETYKTTKEKLERSAKMVRTASKQVKRHNRLIQKRYVDKNN
jgi:uncharacterized membrane protein